MKVKPALLLGSKVLLPFLRTLEFHEIFSCWNTPKVRYTSPVSAQKEGIEAVRAAKAKGFNVTCSVNIHHLLYTDQAS